MNELLKDFQLFLAEQKKEKSTIKIYVNEVKQFTSWLQTEQKELHHLQADDFLTFRDSMLSSGMKASTVNKSLSILRSFLTWVNEMKGIHSKFPDDIRLHEDKKNIIWLTHEEEANLLQIAANERNGFKRTRNQALVYVMLYAGLRIDEVSQLLLSSVTEGVLLVFHEGTLVREIPVHSKVKEVLCSWLTSRDYQEKSLYKESPFLFVTERSGRMQPRSIQYVIESYSDRLGFAVTCQILRNTYCRRLVEEGKTAEQIKMYAGHKSILSSNKYFC